MRRIIGAVLAALIIAAPALPASAATESPTLTSNTRGTYDEFDVELWTQRSADPVSMTLTGGGTFTCEWDAENILFRTGKKLGSKKTYQEYGDVVLDYGAEHTITKGSVSYLTVYGWTEDPMIEFYILENYGSYKPGGGKNGSSYKGDIEVDGATYEVYVTTRVEQPSIQGTKTFEQYFSIRKDKRVSGTITISNHFKAWEELGLDMSGKLYEVALCVEGYNSSGSANVYSHMLTVGDTVYGSVSDAPEATEEPEESPAATEVPSPTPSPASATTETPTEAESPSPTEASDDDETAEDKPSKLPLIMFGATGVLVVGGLTVWREMRKEKKNH